MMVYSCWSVLFLPWFMACIVLVDVIVYRVYIHIVHGVLCRPVVFSHDSWRALYWLMPFFSACYLKCIIRSMWRIYCDKMELYSESYFLHSISIISMTNSFWCWKHVYKLLVSSIIAFLKSFVIVSVLYTCKYASIVCRFHNYYLISCKAILENLD